MDFKDRTGYQPVDLYFPDGENQKLISGVEKLAKVVGSTLGPRGRTVLIESPHHLHGMTSTKDGVTVAKSVMLEDPIENLAAMVVRQASERTGTEAGDGTTTSVVLAHAIIDEGLQQIQPHHNTTEVLRYMKEITDDYIVPVLKDRSQAMNDKLMREVAVISANNDQSVGSVIADAYKSVGEGGVVTADRSMNEKTYFEKTSGISFKKGFHNIGYVNNHRRDECILEDVDVLVCDAEIPNVMTIRTVIEHIIRNNRKLLIISPCSTQTVSTLVLNVVQQGWKFCSVEPPSFGYKQHEMMSDIALACGATHFSEKTGNDLSHITPDDLGNVARVVVGRNSTVLALKEGNDEREDITERVDELLDQRKEATKKQDKDWIDQRIASLKGSIATVYVGGTTDMEQKERYDRVDDSICAVRSAIEEGVLPGGGVALLDIARSMDDTDISKMPDERKVAWLILMNAIYAPFDTILSNGGFDPNTVVPSYTERINGFGYNMQTKAMCDMMKAGVIDPTKVVRLEIQNAVSVATTILSTSAVVTMARAYEAQ